MSLRLLLRRIMAFLRLQVDLAGEGAHLNMEISHGGLMR
jgi:hypothetical protein